MREEIEELEVERGEARVFLSHNGAEAFEKSLTKKGFKEERGFKKQVSPFKEVVERRGWKVVLVICSSPMAYTLSLYVYIHETFIILSCYLNCGLT